MNQDILYSYSYPYREKKGAGQVYLGAILATSLFISFFFGSILLFLIIFIIAIMLFTGQQSDFEPNDGRIWVNFSKDRFFFEGKEYLFSEARDFTYFDNPTYENCDLLRFTFKYNSHSDVFIRVFSDVQKQEIYGIIGDNVLENKNNYFSLTDQVLVRFF